MSTRFDALLPRLKELAYLRTLSGLSEWDEQVYMPPKGAAFRGELNAFLSVEYHRRLTDPQLVRDVQALQDDSAGLGEEERAAVRELARDLKHASSLPEEFVQEVAELSSASFHAWEKARPASDFASFQPYLEKMVALKRREAAYLGFSESPYDALLEQFEPGLTASKTAELFTQVRDGLSALLQKIDTKGDPAVLHGTFPQDKQKVFFEEVLRQIGFDLEAGRLDTSAHPFSLGLHPRDLRITTRYDERDLTGGLFGTIHEMGHSLYEYGLPVERFGTPLGEAAAYGIHESQSRGWENCIGRSRAFWEFWYPKLAQAFPDPFKKLSEESSYAALNAVRPSLIRTESDEVTYNLHIIVRFELEKALIEGSLEVKDAPAAWNAKMREYLGVEVPDDAHGILQDVHWSGGMFGYFPSYALGNVYAAQLHAAQRRAMPDLDEKVAKGEFAAIRTWNTEHIHRYGRQYLPEDLIERATGEKPNPNYLLDYLRAKYANLS